MQTNGIKNEIIHYGRQANGQLFELGRIATGGKGSGTYKSIYDKPSKPNPFEGVGSIIITPARQNVIGRIALTPPQARWKFSWGDESEFDMR